MRLFRTLLLVLAMMLMPGVAFAAPSASPGEEVQYQVVTGSFDVWKHSNGTWQNTDGIPGADKPGQRKQPVTTVTCPENFLKNHRLTRVEVKFLPTKEEYNKSPRAQWQDWEQFRKKILQYLPSDLSEATITKIDEDLAQGKVTVRSEFTLSPKMLNLKNPLVRDSLGMSDKQFTDMAEGWRWYLPVLITWYGVPNIQILPNFWADMEGVIPEKLLPNEKVTVKVVFGLDSGYPDALYGVPVVFHNVGGKRYLVQMDPVDPKNALPENHTIKFQPGEIKEYMVTITTQSSSSKIQAYIIGVKNPEAVTTDFLYQIPDIIDQKIKEQKGGGSQ